MKRPLPFQIAGAIVAILLTCLGAIGLFQHLAGSNPHLEEPRKAPGTAAMKSREEILADCQRLVSSAEEKGRVAVARRAQQFHDFVAERQFRHAGKHRTSVRAFAEEITSLGSKGSLVWSKMPFTDRDGYRKRIDRLFRQHLFSSDELGAELRKAVDSALRDLTEIENQLAVDLGAQIAGTSLSPDQQARAVGEFQGVVERIVRAGQWDGAKDLGNLVTAEVASVIGVQVLTRMGVQAGILSAGAASSWYTFGGSLLIGLVADWVWGWIDDPEGDIERAVFAATSRLATDGRNSLNVEFARVLEGRSELWKSTMRALLKNSLAAQP